MNLAELRLHLRDENIRNDAKKRLRRHFGDRATVPLMHESAIGEATASLRAEEGELYFSLTKLVNILQKIQAQCHRQLRCEAICHRVGGGAAGPLVTLLGATGMRISTN